MLVSDAGVLAAGWVERALPHLADVRVEWRLWRDLTPNPKDAEIEAAFESYLESGCDALLAVGGGSCIDVAKAVAVLSGNGGRILDYEGIDRATSPIPPMVMVPTTGGSGADVSQFCVVTDTSRGLKATIGGRALVPDVSLTDPEILTTMSPELTAHTGLDALNHAIESCVSEALRLLEQGARARRGADDRRAPPGRGRGPLGSPRDLREREHGEVPRAQHHGQAGCASPRGGRVRRKQARPPRARLAVATVSTHAGRPVRCTMTVRPGRNGRTDGGAGPPSGLRSGSLRAEGG